MLQKGFLTQFSEKRAKNTVGLLLATYLEYRDAGYRPKEEMEQMRDKKVRVVGTYIGMQTLWGDGTIASIVAEVIENIQVVELLNA